MNVYGCSRHLFMKEKDRERTSIHIMYISYWILYSHTNRPATMSTSPYILFQSLIAACCLLLLLLSSSSSWPPLSSLSVIFALFFSPPSTFECHYRRMSFTWETKNKNFVMLKGTNSNAQAKENWGICHSNSVHTKHTSCALSCSIYLLFYLSRLCIEVLALIYM